MGESLGEDEVEIDVDATEDVQISPGLWRRLHTRARYRVSVVGAWARRAPPHPNLPPEGEPRPINWEEVQAMNLVYEDVRSFGRHLDEKLRSLITALAFMTAAGISIFVFAARSGSNDLQFDGHSWNVANVFFVVFVVSITLSLASAMVAMDPTGHRPHFLHGAPIPHSILYYEAILADPWWQLPHSAVTLDDLHDRLFRSLRGDTFSLARRARHKAARAQNCEALLAVAMVCLVIVSIARLPQSGAATRTYLVLGVLGLFSASPFVTYWRMRAADFPALSGREVVASRGNAARLATFFVLPFLTFVFLALLSLIWERAHWPALVFGILWVGSGRLLVYTKNGPRGAAVVSIIGLAFGLWMVADASALRLPLPLRLELSHALRRQDGISQAVLCARITGRAGSQVELRITGGATIPVTPINVRLSEHGTHTTSFSVVPQSQYGVDARELSDPDFKHEAYYFPATSRTLAAGKFRCPPLVIGQSVAPGGP